MASFHCRLLLTNILLKVSVFRISIRLNHVSLKFERFSYSRSPKFSISLNIIAPWKKWWRPWLNGWAGFKWWNLDSKFSISLNYAVAKKMACSWLRWMDKVYTIKSKSKASIYDTCISISKLTIYFYIERLYKSAAYPSFFLSLKHPDSRHPFFLIYSLRPQKNATLASQGVKQFQIWLNLHKHL